ncbi:MAG: hypothetical protein HN595_05820 [Flavobacteriaceae bacterium]|jgi:hypothetical protein|nr:hypothetical protein [Flavobacteriaceae bacterium]
MENLIIKNIILFIVFISVGILFSILSLKIIKRIFDKQAKLTDLISNLSFIILSSSSLISLGLIFSKLYNPLFEIIRILEPQNFLIELLKYSFIFLFLSFLSWFIVVFLSITFFSFLTKDINEVEEIKKDNWKISLLISAVIFMLTLLVSNPVVGLLESIIPYPEIPNIF